MTDNESWLRGSLCFICLTFGIAYTATHAQAQPTRDQVQTALHRAVTFFRQHAAAGGGYVYQLSADLARREGEGKVGPTTAWIQPPGTPTVGMAYLDAYQTH